MTDSLTPASVEAPAISHEEHSLSSWPTPEITVLGQVTLNVAGLQIRNDWASRAADYQPTIVHFDTQHPVLEVSGNRHRFASSAARLVGHLLMCNLEPQSRSDLTDMLVETYGITRNSASSVIAEGAMPLRFSKLDPNGSLIVAGRGTIGLREDLVFLPLPERPLQLVTPLTQEDDSPRKVTVQRERPIEIRRDLKTNQYYAVWWGKYRPNPPTTESSIPEDETRPVVMKGQARFTFPKAKKPLAPKPIRPTKIRRAKSGQYYAAWWPKYTPDSNPEAVTKQEDIESNDATSHQLQFLFIGEDAFGQEYFFTFGDTAVELAETTEPQKVPIPLAQPQDDMQLTLDLKKLSHAAEDAPESAVEQVSEALNPESNQMIESEVDTLSQIATTAAFDYFFYGGELPVASDVLTYNAFQEALREIGGYGYVESSSPVVEKYLGVGNHTLSTEIRGRIKKLGESIHLGDTRRINPAKPSAVGTELLADYDREWVIDAACRSFNTDIYFPVSLKDYADPIVIAAKELCGVCAVQAECLTYALETNQQSGIWGGLDEEERRLIKNRGRQY